MTHASEAGIVTTTMATRDDARRLAGTLLKERLAACAQLMEIESHYVWQGEQKAEPEVMLLIKTRAALFEQVIARIRVLHPYETPEIVAQAFSAGFAPYIAWISESTS